VRSTSCECMTYIEHSTVQHTTPSVDHKASGISTVGVYNCLPGAHWRALGHSTCASVPCASWSGGSSLEWGTWRRTCRPSRRCPPLQPHQHRTVHLHCHAITQNTTAALQTHPQHCSWNRNSWQTVRLSVRYHVTWRSTDSAAQCIRLMKPASSYYFQKYFSWNQAQPGVILKKLIKQNYKCSGRRKRRSGNKSSICCCCCVVSSVAQEASQSLITLKSPDWLYLLVPAYTCFPVV